MSSVKSKSFILLGFSLLFSAFLAEFFLRSFFPQPTYSSLLSKVGSYFAPSEYNTFTLQENFKGTEPSMEFPGLEVKVTTNSLGLRGPELKQNKKNILVVGDSYTFGVFVGDSETYPAQLSSLIDTEKKNFQVINAGYAAGFETDQQYVWLKKNLKKFNPEIVVLGVFLGNDVWGIKQEFWKDLDEKKLPERWENTSYVVDDFGIIRNKDPETQNTVGVEPIYQIPYLRESHLGIFLARVVEKIFSGGFIVPKNLKGGIGFLESFFAHIYGDYSESFKKKESLFLELLDGMKKQVESQGSRFFVLLIPPNFIVQEELFEKVFAVSTKYKNSKAVYYEKIETTLKNRQFSVINFHSAMVNSLKEEGPFFPSNGEVHCNPQGYSFIARKLFNKMRQEGAI